MATSPLSDTWSTPEVGYFMPRKLLSKGDELKHLETGPDLITRFYNVHAFIAHLHGLLVFKQEPIVRKNIYYCLRDDALDWFNTELNDTMRTGLKVHDLNSPQGWFKMLIRRFAPPDEVSLFRIEHTDFEIDPAENKSQEVSSAGELARNIIRYNEALGVDTKAGQMASIWDRLHKVQPFSGRVVKPRTSGNVTCMSEFFKQIDSADQIRMYQIDRDARGYWDLWWNGRGEGKGQKFTVEEDTEEDSEGSTDEDSD